VVAKQHSIGASGRADAPLRPIESLLRNLVPAAHVASATEGAGAALAHAVHGSQLVRACFGERAAWVGPARSSVTLALDIARAAHRPGVDLLVLARHGIVTWGATAQACSDALEAALAHANRFLAARRCGPGFGGRALAPIASDRAAALLPALLALVRETVSSARPKVVVLDTSEQVLEFVCSRDAPLLSQASLLRADHAVETKRVPLWLDFEPPYDDLEGLAQQLAVAVARFRRDQRAIAAEFGERDTTAIDPDPRVVLIAGVGMVTTGADRAAAHRTRDIFRRSIAVIGGVADIDRLAPPTARDAYLAECRRP
jgi:rhamnose utilization protein RhaD (predicted bifunctional aldolase and dehydrogenase)